MANTLLTLNRHTEKSEEEAAMTLLDLSSEPVASYWRARWEKHLKTCRNSLVPELFLDFSPLREPQSGEHGCRKAAITFGKQD